MTVIDRGPHGIALGELARDIVKKDAAAVAAAWAPAFLVVERTSFVPIDVPSPTIVPGRKLDDGGMTAEGGTD